jgi:hypothetical protein
MPLSSGNQNSTEEKYMSFWLALLRTIELLPLKEQKAICTTSMM